MPGKVARTSAGHAQTSKSTSKSSSKTSSTSKSSSSSTVKKTTQSAPPPKPKNVDKVEFNTAKPKVDAGTYKPPAPHKPAPPPPHKPSSCTAQDWSPSSQPKWAITGEIPKATNDLPAPTKEVIEKVAEIVEPCLHHMPFIDDIN